MFPLVIKKKKKNIHQQSPPLVLGTPLHPKQLTTSPRCLFWVLAVIHLQETSLGMALFPDALDRTGQALSWPSLLDAYSETFHLQTLGGDEPPTFHQVDHSASWAVTATTTSCWNQQVEHPRPAAEHNPTPGFFSGPTPDWWRCLRLDGGMTESQCGWDASEIRAGDSESTREGNSEEEWLELAGWSIAAPQCQNWDRRHRMLLPGVEARCSHSAMDEAAAPLAPAPPDLAPSRGEDLRLGVCDGLETIAWDADCLGDFAGNAWGERELADRSKVMADHPLCMSHCHPEAAGEEKVEMQRGRSTRSPSFFVCDVILHLFFLLNQAAPLLSLFLFFLRTVGLAESCVHVSDSLFLSVFQAPKQSVIRAAYGQLLKRKR